MRRLRNFTLLSAALLFSACATPPTPPGPGPEHLDLEGLWLVTGSGSASYVKEGTTTLEFGSDRSGSARYLNRSEANGIIFCESHQYTALSNEVVLLDGDHYEVTASSSDEVELTFDDQLLTLTRVSGSPPVEQCQVANAVTVATLNEEAGSWTSLSAFADQLYFNTDEPGNPIVGLDIDTGLFDIGREYTGNHDHVIAARSAGEFYGHCACGNITTVERFDVDSDTMLASANSQVDYGHFMTLERGVHTGASLLVSGRDFEQPGVNHVLSLDPETLALQSERDVLPEASIDALAWNGSQIAALVGGLIVMIGADGMAEQTIRVQGAINDFPQGLAFADGAYYVLYEGADDTSVIVRLQMP